MSFSDKEIIATLCRIIADSLCKYVLTSTGYNMCFHYAAAENSHSPSFRSFLAEPENARAETVLPAPEMMMSDCIDTLLCPYLITRIFWK